MARCKRFARKMDGGYVCPGRAKPRMGGFCERCRALGRDVRHLDRVKVGLSSPLWRPVPLLVAQVDRAEYRRRRR